MTVRIVLRDNRTDFYAHLHEIRGEPLAGRWPQLEASTSSEAGYNNGRPDLETDCPYAGRGTLVLRSQAAVNDLWPLLDPWGEFLPVELVTGRAWLFNALQITNCLDEEHSVLKRFSGGRIMSIQRLVLQPASVGDVEVFRAKGYESHIFYTGQFVDRAVDLGLTGLQFSLAWTDEADGPQPEDPAAVRERQQATPVTVAEIEALSDARLDDRLWARLSRLIDYFDPRELRAQAPEIAAFVATRVVEWEVANGGLHQYFFNFADPDHFALVLDGYSTLGLYEVRRDLEEIVEPLARAEASWRQLAGDGTIEMFFDSYATSALPDHDHRITMHDLERLQLVRATAQTFAI